MIKPFYMLTGQIDVVKRHSYVFSDQLYVEKTYMDENGDRAIVATPIREEEAV
jgi:hypothetical protein